MSNSNGKVAFSLGGKKKKKASSQAAKDTAAAFGHDPNAEKADDQQSSTNNQNQAPLVIPLSKPTQSLLARVKAEEDNQPDNNNEQIKQEDAVADAPPSSAPITVKVDPDAPVVSASNGERIIRQTASSMPGDSSRDQLQRDLEQLPDQADEEQYSQVPISQFGAALLRGMGWDESQEANNSNKNEPGMPRPHRLGLGAIPKAPTGDEHMPSVLGGRNKKKKKLTVQQLQQEEEFERKRQLQLKQDKQRTLQIGSIVYIHPDGQRAKVVQLQGVPGLNMVLVHFEGDAEPTSIKKGGLGELVPRAELEERPFVVPEPPKRDRRSASRDRKGDEGRRNRRDRNRSRERDEDRRRSRDRDHDRKSRKRERSRSQSDDSDRNSDRKRHDRSRSRSRDRETGDRRERRRDRRERSRSRSEDRVSRDRKLDRKRDRRERSRSRSRDRELDDRKSERRRHRDKSEERRERKRDRKRDRSSRHNDEESDRDSHRRGEKHSRKRSKSEKDNTDDNNPLWIIPNIRVRVITEKLGKRYFRQKGVVVDVTRRHGATLRMDTVESNGNSTVLEHVPERYLETALPKAGGNAIVLTGSNKWTKGRLLERNSKTSKGAIQVFEDMSILTLSLDDIAEWCGPLDECLG